MSADMTTILSEMLDGCISMVINMAKILVPISIIIELLNAYDVMRRIVAAFSWVAKLLTISKEAVLPLIVGLSMGVTYGAGTLMTLQEEKPMEKRDLVIVGAAIYTGHAVFELVFVYAIAGANVPIGIIGSLLYIFAATAICARTPVVNLLMRK